MTLFVDTSALFGALDRSDSEHDRARALLDSDEDKVTTDHVIVELWLLVQRRMGTSEADQTIARVVRGATDVVPVGLADLQIALVVAEDFPDQEFSLVDRTSFAVMNRLGVTRVATFDHHFAVYRFGPGGRRAFEIVR